MNRRMSDQELFALFQQNLPSEKVPDAFAERLHQQVLAEVARSIRQEEVMPAAAPHSGLIDQDVLGSIPFGHANRARQLKREPQSQSWFGKLLNGQLSFGFGRMPALAGMAVAVVCLAFLLVQYLAAPPTPVMAMVHVTDGTAVIFRRATGESELVMSGDTALLGEGDQLITDRGTARIEYVSGQSTLVQPGSRVELAELNVDDDHSEVVLHLYSGETFNEITAGFDAGDRFEVQTTTAKSSATLAGAYDGSAFTVAVGADENTHLTNISGIVNVDTDAGRTTLGAAQQAIVERGKPATVEPKPVVSDVGPTPTWTPDPALSMQGNILPPTPTVVILTPTRAPTFTAAPTATSAPSATSTAPAVIRLPTSTATLLATATSSATATSTMTPSATATGTAAIVLPTITATATATATPTEPPLPTSTPLAPTATPVPPTSTPRPTDTPRPTSTPQPTDTPRPTSEPTSTWTPSALPTWTPVAQPTRTPAETIPQPPGGTLPEPNH